jgi:RNA polymerase sigma-70 factor (ECF subfamily)
MASTLEALPDREIDARWLAGDTAILGELHRRYRSRLEAVATRVLGDTGDAEDVVQRIFVGLPAAGYRGTASLWTYLYRAALNGSVNVLRGRRRREALEQRLAERHRAVLELAPQSGPDTRVFEGEVLGAVANALLSVKPRHREALVLRIVQDLPNIEIAERLGVPMATVGTWLRRGRQELRDALGPLAEALEDDLS